jgi:pyridoxamine 5'-phosphate oxidase
MSEPGNDPFDSFAVWFAEAEKSEPNDPNAMAVASVGADGMPSLRMVLLKGWDRNGFVFYTNLESRKGVQLREHPQAALLFHWKSLRRQVRIEGLVERATDHEADEYFATRPRGSQIGAWASQQSRPLESRFALEKQVALYAAKFALGAVPRPPFWSGFRVKPVMFEFWRGMPFRLHDRTVFTRSSPDETVWKTEKLYP